MKMNKKKKKNSFWKTCWLDIVVLTIFTLLISANFNLSKFSPSVLYRSDPSDDSFTTDLFFRISNSSEERRIVPDITLIDIDSIKNRTELVMLLSKVLDKKPRVIGFDVFFRERTNSAEDSLLAEFMSKIKHDGCFIFANDYSDEALPQVSHSFFLGREDSLSEGFVNFIFDKKYMNVRTFRNEKETNEGRQQSLAYRMITSQKQDGMIDKDSIYYIDYRLSSFQELSPDEIEDAQIEGQWVLIGSKSESHDVYNTPIGMMPGLRIHAYILKTLLSKTPIHPSSKTGDWIVLFIVCLLSSLTLVYTDYYVFQSHNKKLGFIIQVGGFAFLLIFFQVLFLLLFAYILFEYCNVFFSMQSSLNSVLFVTAIVKTLYAVCMAYLGKKNKAKSLLDRFMYYSINIQS